MSYLHRFAVPGAVVLTLALVGCSGSQPTTRPSAAASQPPAQSSTQASATATQAATQVATQAPSPAPASASAAAQETVSVALNWPVPEYTHTGITMAQARGYYDEASLKVDLQPLDGSSSVIQAVGAGAANIGFAGAGAIISGFSQDLPIKVVANHLQYTPTGILYQPEFQVDSFEDLKGMSIATQATGEDTVNLYAFLKNAGLDPDKDVDIQVVDGAIKCTLMLSKTVDACTGFSTGHLVRARAENPDIKFLPFQTAELQPIGHSIIVNTNWLTGHEDVLRRFLEATYRGYKEADSHLQELAQIYTQMYPEEGIDLYYESAVEAHKLMHSPRTDEHGWGWMEDKPWADLQTLMLGAGTIEKETPVSEMYTNEYLPANATF